MGKQVSITGYAIIRNNQIWMDGELVFEKKGVSANDFFNAAYELLQLSYPKFFKMDNLCKTGFLAGEYLQSGLCFCRDFSL